MQLTSRSKKPTLDAVVMFDALKIPTEAASSACADVADPMRSEPGSRGLECQAGHIAPMPFRDGLDIILAHAFDVLGYNIWAIRCYQSYGSTLR